GQRTQSATSAKDPCARVNGLGADRTRQTPYFSVSFAGCLQAGSSYSNRVPVALPQPEKTRFPSASKNWIVALYSKLLALVRWTLAVTTPTQQRRRFRHRRKIYRGRSNSDYPARAARDQPRGCRADPYREGWRRRSGCRRGKKSLGLGKAVASGWDHR